MKMNKKALLSLALIGILAFGVGLGTYAWFTSTAVSTDNTFESGTLMLNTNGTIDDPNTTDAAFTLDLGALGNLKPGDITSEESVEIKNDGSLNLAWFGKIMIDGDTMLGDAIYIKEMKMEFLNSAGEANVWEPTDHFIHEGRGYGLYSDHFEGLVDSTMGYITLNNFLSDNAMGAGSGVQMGALKPGYSYRLTFQLGMAEAADNQYQGKTMNLKYVVNATQIDEDALDALFNNTTYLGGTGSNHYNWLNTQIGKQ